MNLKHDPHGRLTMKHISSAIFFKIILLLLSLPVYLMAQDPVIAFYQFKYTSEITLKEESEIRRAFQDEFTKSAKFVVIENEFTSIMLKEQGYKSLPECDDEGCLLPIGKALVVNILFGGSLTRKKGKIQIDLIAVDVTSGRPAFKNEYYINAENIDQVYVYSRVTAGDIIDKLLQSESQKQVTSKSDLKNESKVSKKSGKKTATWITVSTVILSGGAAATYFLYFDKKDNSSTNQGSTEISLDDTPIRTRP